MKGKNMMWKKIILAIKQMYEWIKGLIGNKEINVPYNSGVIVSGGDVGRDINNNVVNNVIELSVKEKVNKLNIHETTTINGLRATIGYACKELSPKKFKINTAIEMMIATAHLRPQNYNITRVE